MVDESLQGTRTMHSDAERASGRQNLISNLYLHNEGRERTVSASVIIVLYHTPQSSFTKTLSALDNQTTTEFEVVIVDNGSDWDVKALAKETPSVRVYAELAENYGVTIGRNVGAELACGDVFIFLDDDAVPHEQFVQRHIEAQEDGIIAARGRVLPRDEHFFNRLQVHYDLGEASFPVLLNTEGNLSVDAQAYRDAGGFDESLRGRAGHEGVLLTWDLFQTGVAREDVVYLPEAVIYHDYCENLRGYVWKEASRLHVERSLRKNHPQIHSFEQCYDLDRGPDLTLIERVQAAAIWTVVRLVAFFLRLSR